MSIPSEEQLRAFLESARRAQEEVDELTKFVCPVCGMTSHNPHDIEEGYCGNCHDWTGT